LPDTAKIEKRTATQDVEGGLVEDFTTRFASLDCQFSAHGSIATAASTITEARNAAGEFVHADAICYVKGDQPDIVESDRATIRGEVFDIVGVQRDSWGVVTTLHLERRSP
jgi:head-tail adaptor